MKTQKPVNQKTIYHSYADLYERIMNDEINLDKAEKAEKALSGMNRTYMLELKRAELEHELKGKIENTKIRTIELKDFAELPDSNQNVTS